MQRLPRPSRMAQPLCPMAPKFRSAVVAEEYSEQVTLDCRLGSESRRAEARHCATALEVEACCQAVDSGLSAARALVPHLQWAQQEKPPG
jgi:hypothetical protein